MAGHEARRTRTTGVGWRRHTVSSVPTNPIRALLIMHSVQRADFQSRIVLALPRPPSGGMKCPGSSAPALRHPPNGACDGVAFLYPNGRCGGPEAPTERVSVPLSPSHQALARAFANP